MERKNTLILIVLIFIIGLSIKLFLPIISGNVSKDAAVAGRKAAQDNIPLENRDTILSALSAIHSGTKREIDDSIELLLSSDVPERIKKYFSDFKNNYELPQNTESKEVDFNNLTNRFIENSSVIEQYFENDKHKKTYASWIPLYFIKKYNSFEKKQAKVRNVYRNFLDNYVDGNVSLTKDNADIICLYVYATYEQANSKTELGNLRSEIEAFKEFYKNDLGDNGQMQIQKTYLDNACAIIHDSPTRKHLRIWKRLKRYENL